MQSTFLNLNWKDLGKAVIVLFISTFLTGVVQSLDSGVLPTLAQIKAAAIIGGTAAISYLIKNLFTNSDGQVAKTEAK